MVERWRPARPTQDISPLMRWVWEREQIRKKRARGEPPPWTEDPILQKYRFCNVRRRDDRVSQWMLTNVLQHEPSWDNKLEFLKWVSVCRWVNWPPTLEAIMEEQLITGDEIKIGAMGRFVDARAKETKAWTGAYMVRAPSKKHWGNMTKGCFVTKIVIDAALDQVGGAALNACGSNAQQGSCKAVWEALSSAPNWGSFMAGQVVADLTYTDLLKSASDLYTWAPMGPGSKRGFNRIMGRPLKTAITEEEWSERLQAWRVCLLKELGQGEDYLTLHDVQNCLCEVDKYIRAKNGEGRPRSTYKPETAYEV